MKIWVLLKLDSGIIISKIVEFQQTRMNILDGVRSAVWFQQKSRNNGEGATVSENKVTKDRQHCRKLKTHSVKFVLAWIVTMQYKNSKYISLQKQKNEGTTKKRKTQTTHEWLGKQ